MNPHPIENIMRTTLEKIREMIDVNTIIGTAVHTGDGTMVIPVSRVGFGFVAGGGEYNYELKPAKSELPAGMEWPFAGGTGAGVSVSPMGFLVVSNGQVKVLSMTLDTPYDRIIEMVPQVIDEIKCFIKKDKEQPQNTQNQGAQASQTSAGTAQNQANAQYGVPQDENF